MRHTGEIQARARGLERGIDRLERPDRGSDDAAWITGQVISVDGGASLMDTILPLEMQDPELAAQR